MFTDTDERLLRALDCASDILLPSHEHYFAEFEGEDLQRLVLDQLQAQTAALTAIAFLLLRRDDEALEQWHRY